MKVEMVVKEYVKRISNDDLAYLGIRFKQDMCGDKAEIALKLAQDAEVDQWLATSKSADEWFEMVEYIGDCVKIEYNRRVGDEADEKRPRRKSFRRE